MDVGRGRGVFGFGGCACGGAGGPWGSGASALIEVVLRDRVGVGGIEPGGLIEVVRESILGDLICLATALAHVEFGLGRPPGGMDQRG